MTPDSIRALLDAAAKATPGPWTLALTPANFDFMYAASPDTVAALARIALAAVEMMDYGAAMDYPGLRDALHDAGLSS